MSVEGQNNRPTVVSHRPIVARELGASEGPSIAEDGTCEVRFGILSGADVERTTHLRAWRYDQNLGEHYRVIQAFRNQISPAPLTSSIQSWTWMLNRGTSAISHSALVHREVHAASSSSSAFASFRSRVSNPSVNQP